MGKLLDHLDRTAFMGTAILEDVNFKNGIIEYDMAVTGQRSYPGIFFRVQSQNDYEHFYIRPHRAGLYPDALQYTPTQMELEPGSYLMAKDVQPRLINFQKRMVSCSFGN